MVGRRGRGRQRVGGGTEEGQKDIKESGDVIYIIKTRERDQGPTTGSPRTIMAIKLGEKEIASRVAGKFRDVIWMSSPFFIETAACLCFTEFSLFPLTIATSRSMRTLAWSQAWGNLKSLINGHDYTDPNEKTLRA